MPRASSRSPPSRGRGSKLVIHGLELQRVRGRPLRGGVDRNMPFGCSPRRPMLVAPFAGAWIETISLGLRRRRACGRPLRGGVDRNFGMARPLQQTKPSPPSRGRGSKLERQLVQGIGPRVSVVE